MHPHATIIKTLWDGLPDPDRQALAAELLPSPAPSAPAGPTNLNLRQAQEFLACSRTKFWELRKRGLIPAVSLGKRGKIFRREDLEKFCKKGGAQ